MTLRKEQPVFFKKIPATEQTPPNATVNRYLDKLNGEYVVEIIHAGAKWLVKESELLDHDAAMARRAQELNQKIEALRPKHSRKPDLIKALGICESTYRRWNRIIQNYLPKVQDELIPNREERPA